MRPVVLLSLFVAACGSAAETPEPTSPLDFSGEVIEGEPVLAPEPTIPSIPWSASSMGLSPMELAPSQTVPCSPSTIVLTETTIGLRQADVLTILSGPIDDAQLAPVLRRQPADFRTTALAGAYSGPGGAGLFAWRTEQDHPALLVDRRVSLARLAAVMRVLDEQSHGVLIRGVDAAGHDVCFLTVRPRAFDGAEPGRAYGVEADAVGDARSERDGAPFTIDGTTAPWPGQGTEQRIPVHVRGAAGVDASAFLRAAARIPSRERYVVLVP